MQKGGGVGGDKKTTPDLIYSIRLEKKLEYL